MGCNHQPEQSLQWNINYFVWKPLLVYGVRKQWIGLQIWKNICKSGLVKVKVAVSCSHMDSTIFALPVNCPKKSFQWGNHPTFMHHCNMIWKLNKGTNSMVTASLGDCRPGSKPHVSPANGFCWCIQNVDCARFLIDVICPMVSKDLYLYDFYVDIYLYSYIFIICLLACRLLSRVFVALARSHQTVLILSSILQDKPDISNVFQIFQRIPVTMK